MLGYSSTLKMEAANSSETPVNNYQTTWLTAKKTIIFIRNTRVLDFVHHLVF
jgi:hypothetical protein